MPNALTTLSAGGVVTFAGGTSQVALDPTLTLGDGNLSNTALPNFFTLAGATVSIGAGFVAGDTLNFTDQNGIFGSYDSATGVLRLTGISGWDNYQAALRSITYSFSPSTDDPTEGRTDNARVISWSITDGSHTTQQVNAIGGGYAAPVFLAVDANGTIFVTDDGNGVPSLTALALLNGSYAHPPAPLPNLPGVPAGIAVDSSGSLFITTNPGPDTAFSEALEVFAPTYQTSIVPYSPATTDTFVGIALDAQHNIFIVDQSTASVIKVDGTNFANHAVVYTVPLLIRLQQGVTLEGIAVDAHGNLFVTERLRGFGDVRELTAASDYHDSISLGFGSFTAPTGIAIDSHGDLFVTDTGDSTVKELLGPDYAAVVTIDSTHFLQPTGIALDAHDNIFIADTGHHAVAEMTALPTSMVDIAIAPVITAGASVTFTHANSGAPIALDALLTVSDQASQTLVGATVSIAAGFVAGDTLNFASQNGITGSYDAVHGVLALTSASPASVAAYQQALQSITYSYTGPGSGARTIDWVVNDGAATSNTATSALDVALPPPSVTVGSFPTPSFIGGGSAVALDTALTVADPVSDNLFGATISISSGFLAGDQLNFTNQGGITGQYDAVHGVLTLSSPSGASLTNYQAALNSITYSFNPANGDPTGGGPDTARAITWVVDDSGHTSSPVSTLLTTVHAPPTLSVTGSPTFTQGIAQVLLGAGVTVGDPDSGGMLAGATVRITAGTFTGDGDVLTAATAGTSISASYNSATETLTLSGGDTIAHYKQVLQSVSFYSTSSDATHSGADASRTVTWTVDDGNASNHLATATQTVNVVAPPTVTAGASATFTGGTGNVALDSGVVVHDTESATLVGATVNITAGFMVGDTLNFASQNGITSQYDAAHGILKLSGLATVAQYQAALQSVSYSFTPTTTDPTAGGTDTSRVITWTVDDGTSTSTPIASIGHYNGPLGVAVDANGTVYVTDGSGVSGLPLVNGLYASTPTVLGSLTATRDVIVGQGGALWIADTFNVKELLPPNYATVNTLPFAPTEVLSSIAQDSDGNIFVSEPVVGVIELTAASGYATAVPIPGTNSFPLAIAIDASNNLFVSLTQFGLLEELTAASGYTSAIPIATLQGGVRGLAFDAHGDLFAALDGAHILEFYGPNYSNSIAVNGISLQNIGGVAIDAAGDLFFVAKDDNSVREMLAPATSTLDIVLSPVVAAGATANFIGGGGPVALDSSLAITDQGSTTLTGATVKIAAGFLAGDTLNFTAQNGITGSYDPVHGVLTLTSNAPASLAAYQAVLQSITYSFNPANGDPTHGGADASRSIDWTVTDGTHSGGGSSTLTIVHTAPSLTVTGSPVFTQSGPPVVLDSHATAADPDSNGMLAGATVKIVGGALTGDTLAAATGGTSIGASFDSNSETLTLTGSDTLAHYNQVLESVTYKSTSGDPTDGGADPTRTIAWTVDDGNSANHLATATQTLTIVPLVQFTSPSIIGIAQEGQTLTAPSVGGSGTPTYTWLSSADGFTSPIGTGPTYLVQESDETHTIEVSASVVINGVIQTITSLPTDTVIDAAPTVTTPTVTGLEQAGHTLTASATGNNTLTYQWFSSADNFSHAIGSGASYAVQPVDVSHTLEVTATVTNDNGITVAASTLVPPHVDGTAANDTFVATLGNEFITGHGGNDTVVFDFNLTEAHISFIGNEVIVDTTTSHTILNGMSVYKFADGTVNEKASGDPLVDPLFYYSQYHDVWTAGLDAATHYNTVGWHQGRDPDAFFSTSTYLSLNPAVKASGVDPLTQFEQGGWKTSDPSINFDINPYLKANPDVAVAGVDPLVHFLQNGEAEGRQPIAPTTLVAPNGFDYVYYLQHNPDVAAAHIDPLQHYETIGWKEGRNPNAYFDTAGYLAHNPDVAAAGVNPLDQYDQFGWKEGRDPSTLFDTKAYLAAYPDVAAAHIDPLVQFLQHGIAEGRTPHGDGLWT